jgi:hypothetical protein
MFSTFFDKNEKMNRKIARSDACFPKEKSFEKNMV